MIPQATCPDQERLQEVLDGASEDADLTAHLDECADCQRELENLAQGDTPLPLPCPSPEPPVVETALHRVMDELKDNPTELADDEFALDFLEPSDRPGSIGKFGKYEVEQQVGRGGMGVVLKALDPDLNRIVAIKVIAPQFAASGSMRRRFTREARAAGAVCHDHVVTIHDVDTSGPLPYLVMQYVPGPSLQERLDRNGPLELKEILRIGSQAASGLAAAHAHGLIHRDVKPANILLEDDMERVKLTDFGLARTMDDVRITQSAVLAGTPQYMAPEQARGEPLDPRADLFSLGCVLYAMCTGRPPFRAAAPLVVMKRICEETPRSIREQNPNVPQWLERIVMKLLEKSPAARFQTAAEVSDLLGRCLAHVQQPRRVPLPSIPRGTRIPPRGGRWRRPLAMAAAFLALLVCGLGATVITVRTNQGTLVIDVDDPNTSVTIQGDHVLITDPDGTEIRLRPGDYKVKATKDGKVLEDKPITIKRGEKTIVTVRREKPADAVTRPTVIRADQMFTTEFIDPGTILAPGIPASDAAISPDGKLMAIGAADGPVRILDLATGEVLRVLKGHRTRVRLVRFSPDSNVFGNVLVTFSDDGDIRMWDVETGNSRSAHDLPIKPALAALSPNGRWLAAAADDQAVRLWDTTTGKAFRVFPTDPPIKTLAFSPDGKLLATGTPPGTVRLWDANTGKAVMHMQPARADRDSPGARDALAWITQNDRSIAFSPDGKILACATGEPIIRLWDVASGKEFRKMIISASNVGIVVFSPDGRRLVSVSDDNTLRSWGIAEKKLIFSIEGKDRSFTSVTFSPDGKRLVTVSGDGSVKMYDAATGKQIQLQGTGQPPKANEPPREEGLKSPTGGDPDLDRQAEVTFRRLDKNGDGVLNYDEMPEQLRTERDKWDTNKDGVISLNEYKAYFKVRAELFGAERNQAQWEQMERDRYAERLKMARMLLEQRRTEESAIKLDECERNQRGWEWHYLKRLAAGEKPEFGVTLYTPLRELAFSPDGRRLATGGANGSVRIISASSPGDSNEIAAHAQDVQAVAFSPDGKLLATASTDDTARVWDAASGKPVTPPLKHRGAVHAVAFSPDGRYVATGDAFGEVSLWNPSTGKLVFADRGHVTAVFGVAYTPDSKRIASVGFNGKVSLWNVHVEEQTATLKHVTALEGHTAPVVVVAFSPDGKYLATAGLDKSVRIWKHEMGKEVAILRGHGDAVHAVAFSPDGSRLATASADKTVKLWDAATGTELLTLKGHTDKVTGVAFSPDGKKLATCGADKRIIIYDGSPKAAGESGAAKSTEKAFTVTLRDKSWKLVMEWFSDVSGLSFVGSHFPGGSFTFTGPRDKSYSLGEIVDILNEGLLGAKQPFVLIRNERTFCLVPADKPLDPTVVPRVAVDDLDKRGMSEIVSVKVPLQSTEPLKIQVTGDLAPVVKKLTERFGELKLDAKTNSLFLLDTVGNVKLIIKAVREAEKAELDKRG